jgi:chromate transporter
MTAFGGPAAHIAMMEREIVRKRRWISSERFLDMMGVANLLPGPSSSELAVFIGYEMGGALGLMTAGTCFILPAASLTTAIAWGYMRFGSVARVGGALFGIKPVIVAIVVQAIWVLGPKAIKRSTSIAAIGILAGIASALDVDALVVLVAAGVGSVVAKSMRGDSSASDSRRSLALAPLVGTAGLSSSVALGTLFLTFLKLGAVVFGSGYVLIAFLRSELVERLHWISESQLIDAVAVGQLTPGPVFTTATFIGYILRGFSGAVVATVAIFLPGFAFVAAVRPIITQIRRSALAGAFLDGVNVASLALMTVVMLRLGRVACVDGLTLGISCVSAWLLLRFRVNSSWLILGGGLVGLCLHA